MKSKKLLLPIIILTVGLLAMIAAHMLSNIVKKPSVTEHTFDFSVNYTLNGEEKVFEGNYKCTLSEEGGSASPTERYYTGVHVETNEEAVTHTIAEKDGKELVMHIEFHPDHLLGETPASEYYEDRLIKPVLLVYDSEGQEYSDKESVAEFGIKMTEWHMPLPIENEMVFSHFGRVSVNSILPMLIAAYLTLLASVLFVKRDKEAVVPSNEKLSVILNLSIALAAAPAMALFASLTQIYTPGNELIYQLFYAVSAVTVWFVALSVCLRRRGFSKAGMYLQAVGPVLFAICLIIEPF